MPAKRISLRYLAHQPLVLWRLITFLILGLLTASFLLSYYFIYVHIFQTFDLANAITALNNNMSYSVLDMAGYQAVKQKIDARTAIPVPPKATRNIFTFVSSTPPPASPAYVATSTSP